MTRLLSRLAARRARPEPEPPPVVCYGLLDTAPDPYGPDPYVFGPGPAGGRYVPEVIG